MASRQVEQGIRGYRNRGSEAVAELEPGSASASVPDASLWASRWNPVCLIPRITD